MINNYEVSSSTIAIIPLDKGKSKIIEEDETYVVLKSPKDIIEDSCRYFGSSYEGRHEGTKFLTGINYKSPIIIEETNEMIFFPTSSPRFDNCYWIALRHIDKYEREQNKCKIIFKNGISLPLDISYGSLQNQILRSTLLQSILRDRKISK